jgi:hypothetical protein
VDLIIAEYPDGLRVPSVSYPPTQIPHWNREIPNFLAYMISFATAYLHDDGAFLLFYHDGSNMRRDISGFFKNYNFKIKDEWTIINCLHLINLVNSNKNVSVLHSFKLPSSLHSVGEFLLNYHLIISKYYPSNVVHIILQTLKFKAPLLVRSFVSSPSSIARQAQELVISSDPSIPMVDLSADDVIFNPITSETQLRKLGDGKPWRGPKEKSEQLMQLFITSLSPQNGIMADLTASTGNQYSYSIYSLTVHYCFILIKKF